MKILKKKCKYGHKLSEANLLVEKRGNRTCRKCVYARNKLYRKSESYKEKNYKRHQNNLEFFRKYSKKYNQDGKSKIAVIKWNNKNPEKLKAHKILNKNITNGIISKKPCNICGKKKVDGHHYDYKKPLDVIWLCRQHHKDLHHGRL